MGGLCVLGDRFGAICTLTRMVLTLLKRWVCYEPMVMLVGGAEIS
ncbi:MAG: hypothetical protein AAGJ35_09995 [Myxococcota bacterium]